MELSGAGKAELKGLLDKLAAFGIQGAATYKEFEGLLQKDLLAAMQDSRKCKLEIIERFQDRLFAPKASGTPPLASAEIEKLRAQALHYAAKAQGALACGELAGANAAEESDGYARARSRLDKLTAKFQNALADDLLGAAGVDVDCAREQVKGSEWVRVL